MVRECMSKSPTIGVGESFVTKWGDIKLISVSDSGSGMIGIKPNGWSEVQVYTVDWRKEVVGPMQVETNFFTMGGSGCHFWVCGPDMPAVTPTPIPTPTPTPVPTKCQQGFRVYNGLITPAAGATVTINGIVYTTSSTGYASALLTVGKEYTATAKFEDRSKTYTFTACRDDLVFRLVTIIILDGFVYCEAYDSVTNAVLHATIKANGVTQPKLTPGKTWNLRAGVYTIEFILSGYVKVTRTVTVVAGETVNLTVSMTKLVTPTPTPVPTPAPTPVPTPVPIGQGKIHCTTNQTGATIQIKDLSLAVPFYLNYGVTNKYYIPLNAGKYSVKYSKAGYEDYITTITVIAGKTMYVPASLTPIATPTPTPTPVPATGYIKCQAYDSVSNAGLNATLRIDGNTIVQKTPHTTPALPIGTHKVTFIHEGYTTKDVTVTVRAGQTANAYGSMVKLALPDVTGFDVKVNIPGLLPKSSLHIQQVVKVPLTDTWWNAPLGHGMRWDNIGNGVFKARGRSADSSPTPAFHTGFDENEDYAIYVGTSAVAFYPGSIIHRSTGKTIEIDLTSSYIDWVSSKVCATFGITPTNCPFFIATSVNDAAFLLELWSIITKHENLAREHTLPTALDYALIPVAIFGLFSPGISEGAITSMVGKRFGKLIELSKKGTIDVKEVAQDPRLSTFMLRATESQLGDLILHLEEGNVATAKILLGITENIAPTNMELNALDRAVKLTQKTGDELVKSNSVETLPTVLSKFNLKFAEVYNNAVKWATAHPTESVIIGLGAAAIAALTYIVENSSINYNQLTTSKGIKAGDTSWTAKDYIGVIDTYMFNVKDAEKAQNWDAFCENLALWKAEVDKLKVFLLTNGTTLRAEGTYNVLESSIQAYYKAIELKEEIHPCVPVTLPEAINAEVIEILDSDTVKIRYDNKDYTVRLLGINAPESSTYEYTCTGVKSPYLIRRLLTPGKECIEEETWTGTKEMYDTSKVWLGQNLPVHQIAQFSSDSARQFDKYGRFLAIPFYNGKNVCMESLKAGQSVVFFYDYNKQVNSGSFLAAEQTAKDAKIGIWKVEAGLGIIRCESNPTAAEVWLDGTFTGKKTISSVAYLYNIPVGEHTVEFKKIIDGVNHKCSRSVTVMKDLTAVASCTLSSGITPTPTPAPTPAPTPTPTPSKATWNIGSVKNEAGAILNAAKVYVDDVYLAHYAPEVITFCNGCICDTVVPCGFGTHTVTIKKTGYADWSKTRTIGPDDLFTDNPIMSLPAAGTFPVTFVSNPSGATIKVDGKVI